MLTIQYVVPTKVINTNQNIRNFIVIKLPLNPKNVKKKSRQPLFSYFLILKTPIFEWYVVWCRFKNGYQRGINCLKEIELGAQHVITILGLIVNISLGGAPI